MASGFGLNPARRVSVLLKGAGFVVLLGFALIMLKSAVVASPVFWGSLARRILLLENAGTNAEPLAIENWAGVECSPDNCVFDIQRHNKLSSVLATRTRFQVPSMEMAAACKRVDIVMSDRWLPWSCRPRWIKADHNMLEVSGGLALYVADQKLVSVNDDNTHKPWVKAAHGANARVELSQ